LSLDDQLAELWAAGASFTDMALKLGESRNVIAGRIDRARAAGDSRFGPRAAPQTARPPLVAKPRPRLLMDLDWNSCRWPVTFATLSMAVSLATHAKLRSDQ
jgi:hypothetical protein